MTKSLIKRLLSTIVVCYRLSSGILLIYDTISTWTKSSIICPKSFIITKNRRKSRRFVPFCGDGGTIRIVLYSLLQYTLLFITPTISKTYEEKIKYGLFG